MNAIGGLGRRRRSPSPPPKVHGSPPPPPPPPSMICFGFRNNSHPSYSQHNQTYLTAADSTSSVPSLAYSSHSSSQPSDEQRAFLLHNNSTKWTTKTSSWWRSTDCSHEEDNEDYQEDEGIDLSPILQQQRQRQQQSPPRNNHLVTKKQDKSAKTKKTKKEKTTSDNFVLTPPHLLTFPTSDEKRRRRKTYEGETEPQGQRGQEMTTPPVVTPTSSLASSSPPYNGNNSPPGNSNNSSNSTPTFRIFGPSKRDTQPQHPNHHHYQQQQHRKTKTRMTRSTTSTAPSTPTESLSQSSSSHYYKRRNNNNNNNNNRTTTTLPYLEEPPPEADSDASSSQLSEAGARDLMQDLFSPNDSAVIPTRANHNNQDKKKTKKKKKPRESPVEDLFSVSTQSSETLELMRPDLLTLEDDDEENDDKNDEKAVHKNDDDDTKPPHDIFTTTKSLATSTTVSSLSCLSVPERLDQMSQAAHTYVEQGEFDLALVLFGKILSLSKQHYGDRHARVASAHHNLGMVHSQRASLLLEGTLQQAHIRQQSLECFQAAARAARDSLGPTHPNVAVSLVKIGFLLLQGRQYHNAFVTFQEALRIRLASLGHAHPLVANLYNNLGVCCLHLGRFDDSHKSLEYALELQRHVLRVERQNCTRPQLRARLLEVADTLVNLGGLGLEELRQSTSASASVVQTRAEQNLAEALEIRSTVLGGSHALVAQVKALHDLVQATTSSNHQDDDHDGNRQLELAQKEQLRQQRTDEVNRSLEVGYQLSPLQQKKFFQETQSSSSLSCTTPTSSTPSRSTPTSSPRDTRKPVSPNNNKHRYRQQLQQQLRSPPPPTHFPEEEIYSSITRGLPETTTTTAMASSTSSPGTTARSVASLSPKTVSSSMAATGSPNVSLSFPEPTNNNNKSVPKKKKKTKKKVPPKPEADPEHRVKRVVSSESVDSISLALRSTDESVKSWSNHNRQRRQRRLSRSPPVTEISLDHGSDQDSAGASLVSFPNHAAAASRPRSQPSKVYMASHSIPRISPHDDDDDKDGPPLTHVTAAAAVMYESEESCLLDDSMERDGGVHGFFRFPDDQEEEEEGGELSSSSHEIMLVRPQLDNVLSTSWGGGSNSIETTTPEESHDEGIAPLLLVSPNDEVAKMQRLGSKLLRLDKKEALPMFQLILERVRDINGELHQDVGAALHNVGLANLRAGQYDEALLHFERAVRVRKGSLGRDHPEVAVSMVKVGVTLLLQQKFDDANQAFYDALTVRKRALGTLHPATARIYNNIGCVHVEFNEARDARRAFEAALDIQRNALVHQPHNGPLLFGAATTLCNLGYLYRLRKMHKNAAIVLKESLQLQERVLDPSHPTVLSTLDGVADSLSLSGQNVEALKFYKILLQRFYDDDAHDNDDTFGTTALSSRNHAKAVLLYKMSRVFRNQRDLQAEFAKLQMALRAARAMTGLEETTPEEHARKQSLEKTVLEAMKRTRQEMNNTHFEWI